MVKIKLTVFIHLLEKQFVDSKHWHTRRKNVVDEFVLLLQPISKMDVN